ncbi:CHKov1 family protein [Megaselia abdita]
MTEVEIPSWIQQSLFEDLLKEEFVDYFKITKFHPSFACAVGENFASVMIRVEIDFELKDGSKKKVSFMIKTTPEKGTVSYNNIENLQLFQKEIEIYKEIIPKFEKLYLDKGKEVKFAPKTYDFKTDSGFRYLLLEDLKVLDFKIIQKENLFDLEQCKLILKLMAKFHAASAVHFETNGPYSETMNVGLFDEKLLEGFIGFNEGMYEVMKEVMIEKYENGEYYANKYFVDEKNHIKELFEFGQVKEDQFNVLNHGDLWCNNIMFNYNSKGKAEKCIFIDYQAPKYGPPAQDLYYFIISSVKNDIKIKNFDFFIKYYHDHLSANLKLLEYSKPIPSLSDIHSILLKSHAAAKRPVTIIMGSVLLPSSDQSKIENYFNRDEEATNFKRTLYSNPKCIEAMNEVLPWLDNRGMLK